MGNPARGAGLTNVAGVSLYPSKRTSWTVRPTSFHSSLILSTSQMSRVGTVAFFSSFGLTRTSPLGISTCKEAQSTTVGGECIDPKQRAGRRRGESRNEGEKKKEEGGRGKERGGGRKARERRKGSKSENRKGARNLLHLLGI